MKNKKAIISFIFFITICCQFVKAASFSSTQNGVWSSPATWGGSGVPGDGDDVSISHDIYISANQMIGTSSGTAITINNSGVLSLNQNIVLTCKGSIYASGQLNLAAGAALEMDTPLPSVIQLTPGTSSAHLAINGTAVQRCSIKATGGAHTRITDNDQPGGGRVVAMFCDFERLGGEPDFQAIQFKLNPNGDPLSFNNCTFNQCSQIKHNWHFDVPAGGHMEFIRCQWTNSVEKINQGQFEEWNIFETWSEYGATAKLLHCDFDKRVALHLPRDLEIEDCVFRDGIHKYTGEWWGGIFKSFKRNFIRWDGYGSVPGIDYGSTIEDCIFIIDNPGGWNPHFGAISQGTGDVNIRGCIWWWTGSSPISEGDGLFIDGASSGTREDNTITIERNIFLPNALGPDGSTNHSCTGITILNESYNKQVVFRRNTLFTGAGIGGINLGENNPATTGDVAYVKSNLFVGGSNNNGRKMNDLGFCQPDVFLADEVNYNGGFRLANGDSHGNGSGKGYDDFPLSGNDVIGPNDVDDTNPLFVDASRTPASWTGSLEATMDALSVTGGSNMSDLLFYIREGFRPQNGAFAAAGDPDDGSPDIGAVDMTTIANLPPTVAISSPAEGTLFNTPINITITATASDEDGVVTLVEFYEGSTKIGEDNSAPYSFTWNNVPGNSYQLRAIATDNENATGSSEEIGILVQNQEATFLVNDFGDDDDFSLSSQIYFDRFYWESNYNIPGENAEFIHQETADDFWVFTTAPDSPELIKSRTIVMTTHAEFYTSVIGEGNTVYLGIRYKDNMPTFYGGAPVYAHDGTDWVEIGSLGGDFDQEWKVEIIPVHPADLSVTDGRYRFKIGYGLWSNGLKGFLSVDRIELATTEMELTNEANVPGYYPAVDDGNFSDMDKDSPWYDDHGDPIFPIGLAAGWTGMSESLFQQVADGGFNTLIFYNWMNIYEPYAADGDVWDVLTSPGHYGFTEFLDECEKRDLKAIGVFQNDVKHFPVQYYFGNESNCLDFIKTAVGINKDHPALLAWSPVDEPDHSDIPDFYAPAEWCMSVKNAIREADPDHPIFALEMGWRQGGYGQFRDIADYQGYDVYPAVGESIALIGERADQLVNETGGEKPFAAYLSAYERTAEDAYMSFGEAYLALIHGANAIFYWELQRADAIWPTISQIANEINSLNNVLLPPATTMDVNGASGLCVDNATQIENRYKLSKEGDEYILAANVENSAANNVQFTVNGLEAGHVINVLFEGRSIIAQDGYFTDDFGAYGRHVYNLGDMVVLTVELSSFEARAIQDDVLLSWKTISETDNKGFEIQKSTDAQSWESIGWVDGNGNTLESNNYYFKDKHPVTGVNYYRYRQFDYSGDFEYSKVVSVAFEKINLSISPNPARNEILVEGYHNRKNTNSLFSISDINGHRLLTGDLRDGAIDISELAEGVYFLRLVNEDEFVGLKFVKME